MAGLGFFFASVLAFMDRKLKVKENPITEKIENALPGLNCGVCGFMGCRQYAEALMKGKVKTNLCKPGGEDVSREISGILGIKAEKKSRETAILHCCAGNSVRKKKANYVGIKTCQAAHNTFGGEALCDYGCLGYGDCLKACPFGAISMVDGLPKVDKTKCTACGRCVSRCPRSLFTIEKIDSPNFAYVACSNLDKGPEAKKICPVACIACGICQRLTGGTFYVDGNLARVHSEGLNNLNSTKEIVDKCPAKCIMSL